MGQTEEAPRIGVFVCHCGINIGGVVNVPEVVKYSMTLPNVVYAEDNLYTCSSEGLNRIKEGIKKYNLNRVVVASCTPRTHEPLFRATCEEAGVNKYLFEMANVREQCSWVHMHMPKEATRKAKDIVRMAVARARLLEPRKDIEIDVRPAALVIGAGVAGMNAALRLANQGFKVYLVEREPDVGGMLKRLHRIYPTWQTASEVLEPMVRAVKSHKRIELLTSTIIKSVKGFIGNFNIIVDSMGKEVMFKVGTIIVATGAIEHEPIGLYGYGKYEGVITQLQLEEILRDGRLGMLKAVVMILCVEAREPNGRAYCGRICCATSIKNALLIKRASQETDVYILYRDIQAYGKELEEHYRAAREAGITFINYALDNPPKVLDEPFGRLKVKVYDVLLHMDIEIQCDLIVLSTPMIQHVHGKELSRMLKVPLGTDEFFLEAHLKLKPVDFATDGIYVCGTAHGPKDVSESVIQAYAAASRASIPMAIGKVRSEAIIASVNESKCMGCGLCKDVCRFGAIVMEGRRAKVMELLCKGCGVCAASCPSSSLIMRHFTDRQIIAQIDAALR